MINHIYQLISPKVFSVKYDDIGGNGKVIVRPSYLAVCHADQRYYLGQRDHKVLAKKLPMALIHEGCAVVLDDPSGTFRRGQKVVMIPNVPARKDDIIYENYAEGSHFLSSGYDGFMREMVDLSADRLVAYEHIPDKLAAITEFVSVAVHAATRFSLAAHARREVITVWGDGSLSYTVCCVLKKLFKSSKINVVGRDMRKLSHFFAYHVHMSLQNYARRLFISFRCRLFHNDIPSRICTAFQIACLCKIQDILRQCRFVSASMRNFRDFLEKVKYPICAKCI